MPFPTPLTASVPLELYDLMAVALCWGGGGGGASPREEDEREKSNILFPRQENFFLRRRRCRVTTPNVIPDYCTLPLPVPEMAKLGQPLASLFFAARSRTLISRTLHSPFIRRHAPPHIRGKERCVQIPFSSSWANNTPTLLSPPPSHYCEKEERGERERENRIGFSTLCQGGGITKGHLS